MWRLLPMPIGALLIVGLVLLASPPRADGQLEIVETFAKGRAALSVAHYADATDAEWNGRVGLIGIASERRNSFAFNQGEWNRLIELCDKAIAASSPRWKQVGAMTETETDDVSRLTLSAGPGLSFVISSPGAATVSYVVDKADLPRLRRALRQVRDYLAR